MKTIIFFTAKRARTPKMQGLATAAGSASIIRELCRLAKAGKGRVDLVDTPTAEHGRRRIAAFRAGDKPDIGAPPITTVLDNRPENGSLSAPPPIRTPPARPAEPAPVLEMS
jgi:hypothetical protein